MSRYNVWTPFRNEEHNITIEISPRRSGKTERLLNEVIQHLWNGGKCGTNAIICAATHMSKLSLRDRLNWKLDCTDRSHLRNSVSIVSCVGTTMRTISNWARQCEGRMVFFDEFEMMENMPLIDNAYYTSTPRRLWRDSETLRFIDKLEGNNINASELHYSFNRLPPSTWASARDAVVFSEIEGSYLDPSLLKEKKESEEDMYLYRLGL